MKNDTPTEEQETMLFASYCRNRGLLFTHIANESGYTTKGNWGKVMKRKRMGVNSGVPDFMIITPKGLIFIEMKRIKGGKVNPEQQNWINELNKLPGVEARVCYGAEEAVKFIEEFL